MSEKKYALVKDQTVINCIVLDDSDLSVQTDVIEHYGADQCVLISEEDLSFVETGSLWNGTNFSAPQPFPSWIWNENTRKWDAPTPQPEQVNPSIVKVYEWDESTLDWVENPDLSYSTDEGSSPLPQL